MAKTRSETVLSLYKKAKNKKQKREAKKENALGSITHLIF
jgi:hypothetical protein